MIGLRASATVALVLACFALQAAAQGTISSDPKKTPKAEETKDQKKAPPPKKTEPAPKKADTTAKKTDDKKAAPKKAPPKKAPAKKVDEKPQSTGQGGTVQKMEAGKTPNLKDAKGNTIQTSPDAYDISSATSPPKKK